MGYTPITMYDLKLYDLEYINNYISIPKGLSLLKLIEKCVKPSKEQVIQLAYAT